MTGWEAEEADRVAREGMTMEEAADKVSSRVYEAACLAERFEVPGTHGRFCGNGHHFAQNCAAFARERFITQWLAKKARQ